MKIVDMGLNITVSMDSALENLIAMASGLDFANVLGVTSPSINNTTSMNTVATMTPIGPKSSVNNHVQIADDRMLTRLLPIRMVVNRRS